MFWNSVERITRSLGRMAEQLDAHADTQVEKHSRHLGKAGQHQARAEAALNEAYRARNVASKVKDLLNG